MKNNELHIVGHVCGNPRLVRSASDGVKSKTEFVIIPNDYFDAIKHRNSLVISAYGDKADEINENIQSGNRLDVIAHVKSFEKIGHFSVNNKQTYGYEFVLDSYKKI